MARIARTALILSLLLLAGGCSAERQGDLLHAVSDAVVKAIVANEPNSVASPAPDREVKLVAKPACVAPSCPKARALRG